MTGFIVRKTDRGFAFVRSEEDGEETFVHASSLVGGDWDEIQEGSRIEYTLIASSRGPQAKNVSLVS